MINNETLLVEIADKYRIPVRIINILYSEDVKTVGQLMDFIPNLQMRHMSKKSLSIILDLQDTLSQELEQKKNDKEIDWEEVRIKAAIGVLNGEISANWFSYIKDDESQAKELSANAVLIADALIAELKKGGGQ